MGHLFFYPGMINFMPAKNMHIDDWHADPHVFHGTSLPTKMVINLYPALE